MGAQSATLLAAGGPLGSPAVLTPAVTAALRAPAGWRLDQVALSHGGVGLAPTAYDGRALTRVLADGATARVHPDLTVELSAPADLAELRKVLDLDTDLTELWAVAPQWHGRGWQLRAGSAFEALVQALAATNTSYSSTQAMVRELVGDGPFPAADQVTPPRRWGYRLPALLHLVEVVGDTDWDAMPDDELLRAVRELPGFGPFAAASVLPLLGRPRPLVLDGWLAKQVDEPARFTRYGPWAGTVLWLEVSSRWRPGRATR